MPDEPQQPPRSIDPRLLALLVCPVSKHPLRYDADRNEVISEAARLAFPVRDGVAILTVEAARRLDDPPHERPPIT
ncbi:MAG: Trm112 family protein [Hyphomicrobiaceae bacterium]